ncbi:hypothetical protein [Anaerocolumna chitinilytica]|uniref:Uncharacterized protein n=1 Tax=Anaerocolumna chitinilytica TaxID=1727145 RepID=A0A7M3SAM3_9FIRM|nr:hypothetical protein [Anaerocolumna chitinilytica]BCK01641.1 hypothetical protein bsdcttw_46810 [Anaerocolumna chitinilytica]
MTKADLKTGYRVQLKNNRTYIVIKDCDTNLYEHQDIVFANSNGFVVGDGYDDSLKSYNDSNYDICFVYDKPGMRNLLILSEKGMLLWKRESIK